MKRKNNMSHSLEQYITAMDETTSKAEYIKLLDSAGFLRLAKYRKTEDREYLWKCPVDIQLIFFLLVLHAEEPEPCKIQLNLW